MAVAMTFDAKLYATGKNFGHEDSARMTGIYAAGAVEEAAWLARRIADMEARTQIPPAWLKLIIADHERTLVTKVEVAVALSEMAWRLAKLVEAE